MEEDIVHILRLSDNYLMYGCSNGDIHIWDPTGENRESTIKSNHTNLKFLLQCRIPGMVITCGRVDEKKDHVIKIWVGESSTKYECVYEVRNIHKSNITHLLCLE
jgi:hypothetical protein